MDYDYQTIDMPVKNREGDYVTKGVDGSIYMLRRMPPGRECDVRRAAELFEAAGNLAKIHLLMRKKNNGKCVGSGEFGGGVYKT